MNNIWFTSDTHFGHFNSIEHSGRPFTCLVEMDEILTLNWNALIKHGDVVYHLGDFCWKHHEQYIDKLNGIINVIPGNHDKGLQKVKHINILNKIHEIKVRGSYPITLCHYPMRSWRSSCHGSWSLHGHSHGTIPLYTNSYDIGVDNNNFFPVHLDEIIQIMNNQ